MTIRGVLIIFTFPLTWPPINASAKLFPATIAIEDVEYSGLVQTLLYFERPPPQPVTIDRRGLNSAWAARN